ncbi:2-polyprenyl-6-methoxyphenol hydroxylase-like FAD-dependent oxidoreductase [Granulicella aggregans]|uniref:Flavin-dependent monooxygenase n=1 Tax=Granulicella aggregans TaxID=474949 RepID=A0A7W7ZEX5_9BACT|nr:FAD-dependent monooxygenase [Granulicella aggregans]MBB5058537.1 2-polyprenyl-6-methoxyphenol hydroxylase-like FAD-dependent oxidoreductase [Granulicella aggregans]
MKRPRVGIVGGGPGGLTLARILHVHGIEAVVFEREAMVTARPQGGSLDMHAESGQYAIECCGLTEKFKRIARYEDQETRVYDKHGSLRFLEDDVAGRERPEVNRGHLRQMLLDSLPAEMVQWKRELSSVELGRDGASTLMFKDGSSESFDLVVGADGAWSKVRALLSDAKPIYSGVTFVELGIDDADQRYPERAKLVGRGLMFALGDSKAIIGHRDANAHIGIYVALRAEEGWIFEDGPGVSSMRASLVGQFSGWSEELLELIRGCDDRMTPRKLYALPVGHRWEHREGVTLLGDAAHLMSPFGGDGANLAMWDAADLALAIVKNDDWKSAVREYEVAMWERAEPAAAGASGALDEVFSEEGLEHMVGHMEERLGGSAAVR